MLRSHTRVARLSDGFPPARSVIGQVGSPIQACDRRLNDATISATDRMRNDFRIAFWLALKTKNRQS
jgi:hypothetical protein